MFFPFVVVSFRLENSGGSAPFALVQTMEPAVLAGYFSVIGEPLLKIFAAEEGSTAVSSLSPSANSKKRPKWLTQS
jgi:hypothetical protein